MKTINLPNYSQANKGGPLGYCHNMHNSKNMKFDYFLDNMNWKYRVKYYISFLFPFLISKKKKYNIQVFHYTMDINFFNTKHCTSILMYHSPVKMSIELKNYVKNKKKIVIYFIFMLFYPLFGFLINRSAKMALNKADILIFPSNGAMLNTYENYKFDKKKVQYIPTIVHMPQTKKLSEYKLGKEVVDVFKNKEKIVIAYIGTAAREKGFLNFTRLVMQTKKDNIIFLNIGNGKKIAGALNLGPIDYVPYILTKIDYLFHFPIKSYYDLIILEAKLFNVPILGNSTGGNRDLLKREEQYNNLDEIISYVNSAKKTYIKKPKVSIDEAKLNMNFFIHSWEELIEHARPLKYSIIVPCYNVAQYLPKFLENIPKNDIKFEIIFINDGSTDGTLDILKDYAKHSDNLVLINLTKNVGISLALNEGTKIMRTNWYTRLDADDIVYPDYFIEIPKYLNDNNVLIRYKFMLMKNEKIYYPGPFRQLYFKYSWGWNCLININFLEKPSWTRKMINEDLYIYGKIYRKLNKKEIYIKKYLSAYRVNRAGSIMNNKNQNKQDVNDLECAYTTYKSNKEIKWSVIRFLLILRIKLKIIRNKRKYRQRDN